MECFIPNSLVVYLQKQVSFHQSRASSAATNDSRQVLCLTVRGALAYWLVPWTPDQVVRVRALDGALCCVLRQNTLVP